ncbi:MAG: GldG family protein [Acidobacteria bacterium]|nr:GldG family protein [Acidobacteriota bacterium]
MTSEPNLNPDAGTPGREPRGLTVAQSRLLTLALIGLVTVLSIHVANEWLEGWRVDLSGGDLYSLTDGTHAILDRMQEEGVNPLDVRLYFSETAGKTLPKFVKDFIGYERYLRSLLGEYERAAAGKIRVETIDPLPDSDDADRAAEDGLDGKLINQNGDLFYFGLAFETQTGSRETIEFLWPQEQENIEYEISKKIHGLLWPARQRVGVLSSLEVFGGAQDPFMAQMLAAQGRTPSQKWIIVQVLEDLYDVSQIAPDVDEISSDEVDLLVVVHPKDLPDKTVFAIDQWVAAGGNTLIFLDPYALGDTPPQNPQQPWMALQYQPASNLESLLAAWGLELPANRFAADFELAARRPMSQFGAAESVIIDLQVDSTLHEGLLDEENPMLRGLSNTRFFLSGVLRELGDAGLEADAGGEAAEEEPGESDTGEAGSAEGIELRPLISTTPAGNTLEVLPGFGGGDGLAYTDLNVGAALRDAFAPGEEPLALAYFVRGRLPTAFPDGVDYPDKEAERPPNLPPEIEVPPPDDAQIIHRDPLPEEERGEAAVVVFADVDFIHDQIAFLQNPFGIIQAANDNHKVVLNSIDYLLGSQDLMSVRAKSGISRPFLRFDEIEAQAELDTLDRERQIREEMESFEEELREKQGEITQRNAALFERKLQEEVDELNERILDGNRELRDIRKGRREALEREESMVRFAVIGWMPIVVLLIGLYRARRR